MNVSHSFSVDVACAVGERRAVILNNFSHWHQTNGTDGKHIFDGYIWTYNSIAAYAKVWPYLTVKEVRTALDGLEKDGYLVTGNYNEWKTDRTKWYALTEKACALLGIEFEAPAHLPKRANAFDQKGKSNRPTGQTELPVEANGIAPQGEPIPLENTIEKPLENQQQQRADADVDGDYFLMMLPKIEEVRSQVLKGRQQMDRVCMNLKITADKYCQLVNAFFDERLADAETGVKIELTDLPKHCKNWIRKQVELGPRSQYHESFKPVPVIPQTNGNRFGPPAPIVSRLVSSIPD